MALVRLALLERTSTFVGLASAWIVQRELSARKTQQVVFIAYLVLMPMKCPLKTNASLARVEQTV